jgi:hypothetical protein
MVLSPGVKSKHQADHSPPSSGREMKMQSFTSMSYTCCLQVIVYKQNSKFTFTLWTTIKHETSGYLLLAMEKLQCSKYVFYSTWLFCVQDTTCPAAWSTRMLKTCKVIRFLKIFHICKNRYFDTLCVQDSSRGF